MYHTGLKEFLRDGKAALAKGGPVAMIFAEDLIEVDTTIRHHQLAGGFAQVLLFAPPDELTLPEDISDTIHRIRYDLSHETALTNAVNAIIDAAEGLWLYYCFNAEYLFHPFCETRNVCEMLTFHTEERRDAVLTYVVDLYADDLDASRTRFRWKTPGWTNPDTMRWGGGRTRKATRRSANWTSSAGCAGGSRNIFPNTAARSTAFRCFAPGKGCACARTTRSMTRNTTPIPAPPGTTMSPPPSSASAPPRR